MRVETTVFHGRKAWRVDNDVLALTVTQGGGHIAGLELRSKRDVNPMWVPIWKTMEPWAYSPDKHAGRYELRLLASICGHNLCLGWFGNPSDSEAKAGMEVHGEAPVARWRLKSKKVTRHDVAMSICCSLPECQMEFVRTVSTKRCTNVIHVKEEIRNTSRRDMPFTMCEHVTVGPPFLERDVTVFDAPATKCHTFPGEFSKCQRFRQDVPFKWPVGPGAKRRNIDMRTISKLDKSSSDFTTQLMNPGRKDAWFSAVNPKLGLLLAYVWKREDFPWLGIWEENHGRSSNPWAGKSLTRGMEFANTPFPIGLRKAVDMGRFQGEPAFRWLPARTTLTMDYDIVYACVPEKTKGVSSIAHTERGIQIDLLT